MAIACPKCQSDNAALASITKTIATSVQDSTLAGKYRILEKLGEGGCLISDYSTAA